MRTLTLMAIAAASFASPAFAQQDMPAGAQAEAATSSVQVRGVQPRFKLDAAQFKDYSGRYLLSNGKGMTLTNQNKRFYAQVDGEAAVEIMPVGFHEFVARGTGTRLSFARFHGNRTNDLVISEPVFGSTTRVSAR